MKFNQEQITEYLNMEANYKDMTQTFKELTEGEQLSASQYEDICRRYAHATIQMIKLRSFVRGPRT